MKAKFPRRKLLRRRRRGGGFTIIESLLAIIIAGIILLGVAPIITVSVATRIQARRVESATQAARTYLEGARANSIQAPATRIYLETKTLKNSTGGLLFDGAPAAAPPDPSTNIEDCITNTYCNGNSFPSMIAVDAPGPSLYCFDADGDGKCKKESLTDIIVQAFRSTTLKDDPGGQDDANQGYILGIRSYRADAFDGGAPLKASNASERTTSATFTGGLGDPKAPLVEMVTAISVRQSDPTRLFPNLCAILSSAPGGTACPNPSPSP